MADPEDFRLSESDSDDGFGKCFENGLEEDAISFGDGYSQVPDETVEVRTEATSSCSNSSPANFQNSLFESFWSGAAPRLTMPWERGVMQHIFGRPPLTSLTSLLARPAPVPMPVVDSLPTEIKSTFQMTPAAFKFSVRRARRLAVKSESVLRDRALKRWFAILNRNAFAFEVGRQILQQSVTLVTDDTIVETLTDVFAPKSTQTLLKRSADVMKFCVCGPRETKFKSFLYPRQSLMNIWLIAGDWEPLLRQLQLFVRP